MWQITGIVVLAAAYSIHVAAWIYMNRGNVRPSIALQFIIEFGTVNIYVFSTKKRLNSNSYCITKSSEH